MNKVFFTSDTHFNHWNIVGYCNRPFQSVEEMNREMIHRWNSVVGSLDTVYHLGDFGLGHPKSWPDIIRRLHGHKVLIRGNHDYGPSQMKEMGFDGVHEKLTLNGWTLQHYPAFGVGDEHVLCGHVHNRWLRFWNMINVGVDVWGFIPRTLEEIMKAPQSQEVFIPASSNGKRGGFEPHNGGPIPPAGAI